MDDRTWDRLNQIAEDTAYLRGRWDQWEKTRQCADHNDRLYSLEKRVYKMGGMVLIGSIVLSSAASAFASYLMR